MNAKKQVCEIDSFDGEILQKLPYKKGQVSPVKVPLSTLSYSLQDQENCDTGKLLTQSMVAGDLTLSYVEETPEGKNTWSVSAPRKRKEGDKTPCEARFTSSSNCIQPIGTKSPKSTSIKIGCEEVDKLEALFENYNKAIVGTLAE